MLLALPYSGLLLRGLNICEICENHLDSQKFLLVSYDLKGQLQCQTSIDVLPSKNQALCKYCTLASKFKTLLILYLVYFRFNIIT